MARARGSNARLAIGLEATYGVPKNTGFTFMSFTQFNLGEEQPLLESDLLGQGREPGEPGMDAITNQGDAVVPLCSRQFGRWLSLGLGAPTTTTGKAASGSILFSDQPANNATISLGGKTFTFTTSTPTSSQIKIGSTLAVTLANAVRVLNASSETEVAAATYRVSDKRNAILVLHDAVGTGGNSFALAASSSPASNGTVSAANLAGGGASGGYRHIFASGAQTLPSASAEVAFPETPAFHMNAGIKLNTIGIQLATSGHLVVNLGLIAQSETVAAASTAGTVATQMEVARFSHFSAIVRRNGVPIADLTGGQLNLSNGLDPVQTVQGDGRIGGIDEGAATYGGSISVRYNGIEFQQQAENGEPCELEFQWSHPATGHQMRIIAHRVFLPKAKKPVTGPGGISADYPWQAAIDPVMGRSLTIILDNDVAGTAYAVS